MVKKSEKSVVKHKKKSLSKAELEEALLNNFVNLQKVLTNLSIRFDDLSDNISKLLQLFEISAKSFAEKYSGEGGSGGDKDLLNKLDSLLDQNKTIAKGIMLMEDRIRQRDNQKGEIRIGPRNLQRDFSGVPQVVREPGSDFEGMMKSRPLPRN